MPVVYSKQDLEEGVVFAPKFDSAGLIAAIVTDAVSGTVLMLAWMNADALRKSIETGETWFWSRSRQCLWHKGATSGQIQQIQEIRIDCDQDAVWLKVRMPAESGCCHTGRASCFYRLISSEQKGPVLEAEYKNSHAK
jgi:phosphoribosyl-AMP cyclohydrolase